jgi:hypothetical protein
VSQLDTTLPPLWNSNTVIGEVQTLFSFPESIMSDISEELERKYTEKFDLEFILFKG